MKKYLLLILLVGIATTAINAQIVLKGIVQEKSMNYEEGDTLKLYGARFNQKLGVKQFYIRHNEYISQTKIKVLNDTLDSWQRMWFEHRGTEVRKRGWATSKTSLLRKSAYEFYAEKIEYDGVYEDEYLYDYIYQLLNEIHPNKLTKQTPENFGLIIVKSSDQTPRTFDNGYVVLTTGDIANLDTEKKLINRLTKCIAQIVLDYNLFVMEGVTRPQKLEKITDAIKYGHTAYMNNLDDSQLLTEALYTAKTASIISFEAWQEFYKMNYGKALELIYRLEEYNLATEKDFLLLSQLIRATSSTKASNLQALAYVEKGRDLGVSNLIDLEKEAGIIYLRLNEKAKAKEAFEKYKKGLLELEKLGFDMSDELEKLNQMMFKNRVMD